MFTHIMTLFLIEKIFNLKANDPIRCFVRKMDAIRSISFSML